MASVAMLVGGAIVNALAFSGSQFLFSSLGSSSAAAERKRHDKAVEQLQSAQAAWSQKRTERLDWINQELRRQGHATHTFQDVDAAIREYSLITRDGADKSQPDTTMYGDPGPEPTLSDFYTPSDDQKDRELTFAVVGLGATMAIAYTLT